MKSISEKLEQIEANRRDIASSHDEVDQWADEQLRDLWPRIIQVKRKDAYSRFVMRYVSQYDPTEHSDDDGEPIPPCTCENDCPIINGRLPARVEDADEQAAAAEQWSIRHTGTPHALLKADEEWRDLLSDIYVDLYRIERGTRTKQIIGSDTEGAAKPDVEMTKSSVPADD